MTEADYVQSRRLDWRLGLMIRTHSTNQLNRSAGLLRNEESHG